MTRATLLVFALISSLAVAMGHEHLERVQAPSLRQLDPPAGLVEVLGRVSPDGRELSFIEAGTGDLSVWIVGARNTGVVAKAACAESSIWAPDGMSLACGWRNSDGTHELRRVDRATGRYTVVSRHEGRVVSPLAWSRSGQHVAAALTTLAPDQTVRDGDLALIRVADGETRILRHLEGTAPDTAAFSPDGRQIAYDFSEKK